LAATSVQASQIDVVGLATKSFWKTSDAASAPIWNYELQRLIADSLYQDGDAVYQDLEMVFNICYGGGFIDYIVAAGLKGTWSASSSVPADKKAGYDYTFKNTPRAGIANAWENDGLNFKWVDTKDKVQDGYANGYSEQYIRAFQQDATRTTRQLHDLAVERNYKNDDRVIEPGVFRSQEGGDSATIRGISGANGTLSRHAIIYSGGERASSRQRVVETLERTLKADPLKYDTVTTMIATGRGLKESPPGIDQTKWKETTLASLTAELQNLRTELLKNPHREKALLFFEGHGATAHERRVVKTKDGDPPVPGEGFTFSNAAPTLTMTLSPDKQASLQQGVPGLGHEDSLELQRIQNPVLNFTTYAESGPGPVDVYLNNVLAGSVFLNGIRSDYMFELSDAVLQTIPWASAPIDLSIRFAFASNAQSFQLSTNYDYFQDPSFSSAFSHYGLGITDILGQGTPDVPEPSTFAFGIMGVVAWLLRGMSRRDR
jgi:hypothetical protein